MARPAVYVADTHSLLWYLYDVPRLGSRAEVASREVSAGRATLLIPAIVLAEIVHIVERRRHDIRWLSHDPAAARDAVTPFVEGNDDQPNL